MVWNHFKEGEASEFYDYLSCLDADGLVDGLKNLFLKDLEAFREFEDIVLSGTIANLEKVIKELPRTPGLINHFEQKAAEAQSYEKVSSFGTSKEEIIENSRSHFLNCPDCLELYKAQIVYSLDYLKLLNQ